MVPKVHLRAKPFVAIIFNSFHPFHVSQPEIAGEAFRSLSFVFKFLGKALIDRADSMWPSFRTLLSSKREYVREFAA